MRRVSVTSTSISARTLCARWTAGYIAASTRRNFGIGMTWREWSRVGVTVITALVLTFACSAGAARRRTTAHNAGRRLQSITGEASAITNATRLDGVRYVPCEWRLIDPRGGV